MTGFVTARRIAISETFVKSPITRSKLIHEPDITHPKRCCWHFCWHFNHAPGVSKTNTRLFGGRETETASTGARAPDCHFVMLLAILLIPEDGILSRNSPRRTALARAGGWLHSGRSANPPHAPRAVSVHRAVRAASRRVGGDDYPFVPPTAPSSRTDRFFISGDANWLKLVHNCVCIQKRMTLRCNNS